MEHTIKVYKNSPEHGEYMEARFPKDRRHSSCSNETFEFRGHRWKYRVTSFDDKGDYDLLYRFDDEPDVQSLTANDATLRDYFAAEALGLCFAQYLNHAEVEGFSENWRDGVAADTYLMADAMLRVREK